MAKSSLQKSTTVRIFQALRLAFRLGDRIAPGPATRLATRLWFTLPPQPARPRAIPATAQQIDLDAAGTTVRGYDWGTGPLVYLQHGWGGSGADFDHLAGSLVAGGHRVIAVDGPSHGHSDPGPYGDKASSPLQLADALRAAIDKFGEPHAVVGHSMGAMVAAITLRERADSCRLVLVSPFIGGQVFMRMFADRLGIGPRVLPRLVAAAERRVGKPMAYFNTEAPALDAETLVVHDRHDRSTPFQHGAAIARSWPNARLSSTEGLGHMRILRSPIVIGEIAGFVSRR